MPEERPAEGRLDVDMEPVNGGADGDPGFISPWTFRGGSTVVSEGPVDEFFYDGEGEVEGELENMADEVEEASSKLQPIVSDVIVPLAESMECWKPWRRALIVKLLGRTVSYRVLQQRLSSLWSLTSRIDIVDMEHGYFVIRFVHKRDYDFALEKGPWVLQGHYLTVTKWKPYFVPSTAKITSTLVWIRFPEFPFEYFRDKYLTQCANKVGKCIKVDSYTLRNTRGKYARVCVELDLNKPLKSSLIFNGRTVRIEYEGLQLICFQCGKFGHRNELCPLNAPAQSPIVVAESSPSIPQGPSVVNPFGPWMIATTRSRRPPTASVGNQGQVSRPSTATTGNQVHAAMGQEGKNKGNYTQRKATPNNHSNQFEVLDVDPDEEIEVLEVEHLREQLGNVQNKGSLVVRQSCGQAGGQEQCRPQKSFIWERRDHRN